MSIILFFAVLFVLILVHEWGHYITAKLTKMKVEEFGIGFPPKLFGLQKGETEYTFNALPIGGFVKILGENGLPAEEGGLSEAEQERAFGSRPKWAQAIVLIAGVTMNVILAWFLIVLTLTMGVLTPVTEGDATDQAQLLIQEVVPNGPAADVFIPGSIITEVKAGDQVISELTPSALTEFVNLVAPEPIMVTYQVGDTEQQSTIVPQAGLLDSEPDRYLIGVRPILVEDKSVGFFEALQLGTSETIARTKIVFNGLTGLIVQSVSGTADYSQVAGPVGIAVMTGDVAELGLVAIMQFMAMLSLSLAVINLLPFPALDGGRLVFVVIEAVTGRKIPPIWAGRLNLVGFVLLMILMIAVTYNDIIRLIS